MADQTDPITMNVAGVSQLVQSDTNKSKHNDKTDEGVGDEKIDILDLSLTDEELLALRDKYISRWATKKSTIENKQKSALAYYKGVQLNGSGFTNDFPIVSNLIWEAAETFYPAALSKNPEPVVYADNTQEGNDESGDIKTMLQYHADTLGLRPKLNRMTRQWSIKFLGVLKHGFDKEINEISLENRKIDGFVFDPDGYVDVFGNFVGYLGEPCSVTAERLIELYPEHKAYILLEVGGKLGTEVTYYQWWSSDDKFTFSTFKEKVLDKHKNEFFDYGQEDTDEFGLPMTIDGKNHFAKPAKPYTFLSVYSIGEEPYDLTSNIEQNISQQNMISKRTMQIDQNLSRQNNSDAFSERNFNQETAKQAANAFLKGNPVLVPEGGPIAEAIVRFPAEGVPDAVFTELQANKEQLRSSFGVQGVTAQPAKEDTTARGMILNQQYDNSRLGGGIGQSLEQVAKNVFNWWVQMYYVFYDEPHMASVLGQMKATEYAIIHNQSLGKRKLIVTVAPDSMKPKDEISQMNQAITLWQEGALDPKTLLTMLDFPDPQITAGQVMLYRTNPQLYLQLNFPDLAQEIAAQVQMTGAVQPAQQGANPAPQGQSQGLQAPPEGGTTGGVEANPSLASVPLPQ